MPDVSLASKFLPTRASRFRMHPNDLRSGDFDGDGNLDLVYSVGAIVIVIGDGRGGFMEQEEQHPASGALREVAPADFNRDGMLDLAVGVMSSSVPPDVRFPGLAYVLINSGKGRLALGATLRFEEGDSRWVTAGDVNQDGLPDVVVGQGDVHQGVPVFVNQGNLKFAAAYLGGPARGDDPLLADFDGDGWLDLLMTHRFSAGLGTWISFQRGGRGLSFDHVQVQVTDLVLGYNVAVGDLNRDRRLDFVVADWPELLFFWNQGGRQFQMGRYPYLLRDAGKSSLAVAGVATGDLNGDGLPEVMVSSLAGRMVSVFMNRGNGLLDTRYYLPVAGTASELIVADFNNDRFRDVGVVVENDPNKREYSFAVFLNRGQW